MIELFYGYIVKVWSDIDFSKEDYKMLNKILVRHCILFYNICLKDRNEWFYNAEKQRKRAIEWYKNMKKHIENNKLVQVKIFVRRNEMNINRSKIKNITQQIYNMKEMIRKVDRLSQNNICRYFEIQCLNKCIKVQSQYIQISTQSMLISIFLFLF